MTLFIKESKVDQAGAGVSRTLGCTCRTSRATCPVKLKATFKTWPATPWEAEAWLSRATDGERATKATVVASRAMAAGAVVKGHSARRSGALCYTRVGVAVPVAHAATWSSTMPRRRGKRGPATWSPPKGKRQRPRASRQRLPRRAICHRGKRWRTLPSRSRSTFAALAGAKRRTFLKTSTALLQLPGGLNVGGASRFKLLTTFTADLRRCQRCRAGSAGSTRQARERVDV